MTKKKKKTFSVKLIAVLVILAALVIAAASGIIATSRSSHAAYVQSVMELNNSWVVTGGDQYGTISDAATQNIYLTSSKVSSVSVTVGQEVNVGDVLFTYDTEGLKDEMDVAKLKLAAQQDQLAIAQLQYDDATNKEVWTDDAAADMQEYLDGTLADQAAIKEQMDDKLYYIKELNAHPEQDSIDVTVYPDEDGNVEDAEGKEVKLNEEGEYKVTMTRQELQDQYDKLNETYQIYEDNVARVKAIIKKHATADAYDDDVRATRLDLQEVQTSVKETQNSIDAIASQISDSSVKATMSGTVSYLSENMVSSSTNPFITITSTNGYTLIGHISEYDLGSVQEGDQIQVTSYMTNTTATAVIVSISPYPDEDYDENYYGQNASYYEFQATIGQTEGFTPGDYVGISMTAAENGIAIDKIYVRSDDEGSYVLKDDGGKLVRCSVTTAQTSESEYLQILDGLTEDDLIAYPYGKSAFEGNTTTTEQSWGILSWLY